MTRTNLLKKKKEDTIEDIITGNKQYCLRKSRIYLWRDTSFEAPRRRIGFCIIEGDSKSCDL